MIALSVLLGSVLFGFGFSFGCTVFQVCSYRFQWALAKRRQAKEMANVMSVANVPQALPGMEQNRN